MKLNMNEGLDVCDAHMLMAAGVYAIIDEDDNVLYVGQTDNFIRRWGQHCSKDSSHHAGVPVAKIYQFIVLEYSDDINERLQLEEKYTDELLPLYARARTKNQKRERSKIGKNLLTWDEPILGEDYYSVLADDELTLTKFLENTRPRYRKEPSMQELYNCKSIDETHYRITKFDKHLDQYHNPKGKPSSYIVSKDGCDCPAGNAPKCRHRKILPAFIEHGYVDTEYFFIWDTQQWYKPTGIFREARKQALDVNELVGTMEVVGIPTVVIDKEMSEMLMQPNPFNPLNEGTPKVASAAPSPQPSTRSWRRR